MRRDEMKRLPKIIYVKREQDGGEEYFVAHEDMDTLVEDEPTLIAQYELVNQSRWKKKVSPID
jgi:hypothetical protein